MKQFIVRYKIGLGFILLSSLLIYGGEKLLAESDAPQSQSSVEETVVQVKKGRITQTISASGQVQTANYFPITSGVNGIVAQVFVKEGDEVVQGQQIMEITLDAEGNRSLTSAYSNYLKAKNALDTASNNLKTAENSKIQAEETFQDEKESNSYQSSDERIAYKLVENSYLRAKTEYDLKKTELGQLQIAVNSAWIDYQSQSPIVVAPASGIVSNIVAVEGSRIENSVSERSIQTVASIKKTGTPISSLNVSEVDINRVKVGQTVDIALNSVRNKKFKATVVGIDKIGSQTSGVANYPVTVKFDTVADEALPNMGVEADIRVASKDKVLYIPTSALIVQGNTFYVISEQGKKEVKVGIADEENTEIISGLSEGDRVTLQSLPTSGFTSPESATRGGFNSFSIFRR
ncbi:MAG: Macrolide export protein MacA [Candidatus Parcubacteria bacterium]